jgi:hypothetical protein
LARGTPTIWQRLLLALVKFADSQWLVTTEIAIVPVAQWALKILATCQIFLPAK